MKIKVQQMHNKAMIPSRSTPGAAGLDLYSVDSCTIRFGRSTVIKTGVAIELPVDTVGLIWPRSGLAAKHGLDILAGVIDCDYRGEIAVVATKSTNGILEINSGTAVAQLLVQPIVYTIPEWHDKLGQTFRADNGFGSTDN